jgi:hypothetical protein
VSGITAGTFHHGSRKKHSEQLSETKHVA